MIDIRFDPQKEKYKTPFGCVRQGQEIRLMVEIPRRNAAINATLVIEKQIGNNDILREKSSFERMEISLCWADLENGNDIYEASFAISECGLYFYYFVEDGRRHKSVYQITVYDKNYDTPFPFKGAVYYQIFPDRFAKAGEPELAYKLEPYTLHENMDEPPFFRPYERAEFMNNDFYGGNLKGITEKLPYLKDLGVTVIYLNPIFMAYSNHRYDTCDYKRIDPMLGDEEDFKRLCLRAKEYGMKVVLDGVFSHTGSRSIYFDINNEFGGGAYHNPDSKYRNWYQFNHYPNDYTSWWGIKTLPCVDEHNEDYVNYIIRDEDSVVAKWMELGADGFRIDVADELPDFFIKELHSVVHSKKGESIIIGEVWEDASNKISYDVRRSYFANTELDSIMNYPFRNAIIELVSGRESTDMFAKNILQICEHYPKPVLDCNMNSVSTHDTVRIINELSAIHPGLTREQEAHYIPADIEEAIEKSKLAVFLQYTLPGCPCIYYGDEAGMTGLRDPYNRRYYPWGREDKDLISFYTDMGKIKNEYKALREGAIFFPKTNRGYICNGNLREFTEANRRIIDNGVCFIRGLGEENIVIFANTSKIEYNYKNVEKIYAYREKEGRILSGGFVLGRLVY